MLLSDEYLCQRKEGKTMLDKLAAAFVERGTDHLQAGRLLQARLDCDNAKKCNIDDTGIAGLADDIDSAEKDEFSRQRRNQDNLKNANDCLNNGRLTMGMKILNDNDSLPGASLLRRQAELRNEQIQDIADKLSKALNDNDIDYVLQLVSDLSSREQASSKMTGLIKTARDMVLTQIKADFANGRLARLIALLDRSRPITADSIEFAEWHDILNCYRQASDMIEAGEYRKALQMLNRIKAIFTDASWLNNLIDGVERTMKAIDDIQFNMPTLNTEPVQQAKVKAPTSQKAKKAGIALKPETKHRLLNIDGAGSYMLFAGNKVSIGPISSIEHKDIAIIAPPNSPIVEIHKDDDDYFARASSGDIIVNKRAQKEALLENGDKIAVSDRGHVKFNRINPASSTAVIDLSSVRLPQADIRAAIIADSEIIIGSSPSAHIKCRDCENDIVLKVNAKGGIEKDGQELVLGNNVEYNNIRLCLV